MCRRRFPSFATAVTGAFAPLYCGDRCRAKARRKRAAARPVVAPPAVVVVADLSATPGRRTAVMGWLHGHADHIPQPPGLTLRELRDCMRAARTAQAVGA